MSLPHSHNPLCLSYRPAFPSTSTFRWPVTHCAGKSDFLSSQGSKLKAHPGRGTRNHILELLADPQRPASPAGRRKMLRSFCPPTPPFLVCLFRFLCESWVVHMLTHLGGFQWSRWCECQSREGLFPIGSHMRAGMKWTYLDLFSEGEVGKNHSGISGGLMNGLFGTIHVGWVIPLFLFHGLS